MELSVVIPTYNNRAVLERTLGALAAQTFPVDRYEVVLVDDGSTDGTAEMIERFRTRLQMTYLPRPHGGRASSRNAGARAARGRILLFLDSDFFAVPGLLAAHYRHYPPDARGIAIQGASRTHPDTLTTPFMRAREFCLPVPPGPPGRISLFRVSTRNLSLLRADFEAAGGFDEAFGGYGWEDIELAWRLRARGVRFTYDPAASGDHYQLQDLEGLRRKMREGGRSAVYFWQKHRRSWWIGLRLEIAPVLLPFKWLVYRTPLITVPVRTVLRVAEARDWRPLLSECTNHLAWEAYYDGVFAARRAARAKGRVAAGVQGRPGIADHNTSSPDAGATTRDMG